MLTFSDSDQLKWLSNHWFMIILIIVVAWIAEYIGEQIIRAVVRKAVHGRHFARPNQSLIDVKKRQDTILSVSIIIWKILILVGTGFAIFTILFPEINLLPVLASAGVLGAVIGFGAQSIIRDFISGAFIIIENQFRVGDDVEIDGAIGKVEHITLRSTVIRDDAGNVHYVANGTILHVINKTMDYSKMYFTLSVTPGTDIDELTELIKTTGLQMAEDDKWHKKIIEPPALFNLGAFSDTAVEVRVAGKTQPGDQYAITTEFKKRLLSAIKKHKNITLAQYQDLSLLGQKN